MENIPIRYINSKELNFSEHFTIRDVSQLLAGKDMVQKLHRHDFFYILVLKKGSGKHAIDFAPYEVCNNSVFFLRPGQVHQLTLKKGSAGYLMEFNTDFYYPHDNVSSQLLRKTSNLNFYQLDANKFKKILSILMYISQEYAGRKEKYQEIIKANLGIFFIELFRNNSKSVSHTPNLYLQGRLEEFLELLETHVCDHKQASYYADILNLSLYQLNAITKATVGKTCSELINEYSILEAKRYLLATTNQVTQIAHHMGYEDVSYFTRFFKKHTGHTPEAFRQNFG